MLKMESIAKIKSDSTIMSLWADGKYELLNVHERVRLCELMEKGIMPDFQK